MTSETLKFAKTLEFPRDFAVFLYHIPTNYDIIGAGKRTGG